MPLDELFKDSPQPAYAVNVAGTIVYANAALCKWVDLELAAIVGHPVAYHCVPQKDAGREAVSGLAPPPFDATEPQPTGTISTMGRDGKLRHRRARFVWIALPSQPEQAQVVALADERDLSPGELAAELSDNPQGDTLHRHIRQFRRTLDVPVANALLLGDSPQATRLRAQFDLAVKTGCSTLITGSCPEDCAAISRALHNAGADSQARLVVVACATVGPEEVLRQVALADTPGGTVILQAADSLTFETQQQVAELLTRSKIKPRLLVTSATNQLADSLLAQATPGVIDCPRLAQRAADLPVMAHFFLEHHNAHSDRSKASFEPEAIDQLAVYDWPQGVGQLAQVVAQACQTCQSTKVSAADLPQVIRHAVLAAALPSVEPVAIQLDAFLEQIEQEAILRALQTSEDNKAEAARLLGMTRQKLYRRLQTLGMVDASQESQGD